MKKELLGRIAVMIRGGRRIPDAIVRAWVIHPPLESQTLIDYTECKLPECAQNGVCIKKQEMLEVRGGFVAGIGKRSQILIEADRVNCQEQDALSNISGLNIVGDADSE